MELAGPTEHDSIHIAAAQQRDHDTVLALMEKLYELQRNLDRKGLVKTLQEMVPEYTPDKNFWS